MFSSPSLPLPRFSISSQSSSGLAPCWVGVGDRVRGRSHPQRYVAHLAPHDARARKTRTGGSVVLSVPSLSSASPHHSPTPTPGVTSPRQHGTGGQTSDDSEFAALKVWGGRCTDTPPMPLTATPSYPLPCTTGTTARDAAISPESAGHPGVPSIGGGAPACCWSRAGTAGPTPAPAAAPVPVIWTTALPTAALGAGHGDALTALPLC